MCTFNCCIFPPHLLFRRKTATHAQHPTQNLHTCTCVCTFSTSSVVLTQDSTRGTTTYETDIHPRACARRTSLYKYSSSSSHDVYFAPIFAIFSSFYSFFAIISLSPIISPFVSSFDRSIFMFFFHMFFLVFVYFFAFKKFFRLSTLFRRVSSCHYDCSYASSQYARIFRNY